MPSNRIPISINVRRLCDAHQNDTGDDADEEEEEEEKVLGRNAKDYPGLRDGNTCNLIRLWIFYNTYSFCIRLSLNEGLSIANL